MASAQRRDDFLKNLGIPFNHIPRPRVPPQLVRPPSPLSLERPQPIVPDVSLIIDSAATSFQSTSGHTFNEDIRFAANNESDRFSFQQNSNVRSADNSGNNSSPHFVNYYPTPEQNSTNSRSDHQQVSQAHSMSKTDSGNGSLSESLPSHSRGSKNDTSAASGHGNLSVNETSRSTKSERSYYSGFDALKSDVATVLKTVQSQADSIVMINSQLQKIIAFQEQFLVQMHHKVPKISKSVQTDSAELEKSEPLPPVDSSVRSDGKDAQKKRHIDRSGSLQRKRSSVDSRTLSPQNSTNKENLGDAKTGGAPVPINERSPPVQLEDEDKKTAEDFSAILRNLQISNVQGPSMYSDTSMKSIVCPPFNEGTFQNENSFCVGPSASVSAQGSDLEDDSAESILPSVTYYNNLLSTVNRILDGGQKPASATNTAEENVNAMLLNLRQHGAVKSHKSRATSRAPSQGTASYSSESSSAEGEEYIPNHRNEYRDFKSSNPNAHMNMALEQHRGTSNEGGDSSAVEATKKYLHSLGIQIDGQSYPQSAPPPALSQKQNYMIQQNVYNSIYIPTVNCVPVISESLDTNSGLLDNLARKYIPSGERNSYEIMAGKRTEPGALAETTVYGMSPGNLSFATKEYLKRHGLVGHQEQSSSPILRNQALPEPQRAYHMEKSPANGFDLNKSDKILDMTAIRNQPKLL